MKLYIERFYLPLYAENTLLTHSIHSNEGLKLLADFLPTNDKLQYVVYFEKIDIKNSFAISGRELKKLLLFLAKKQDLYVAKEVLKNMVAEYQKILGTVNSEEDYEQRFNDIDFFIEKVKTSDNS